MDQDTNTAETSDPGPDLSPARRPRPPRIAPLGGSKWAPLFAGARQAPVAPRRLDLHAPGYLNADGSAASSAPETAPIELAAAMGLPTGGVLPLGTLLTDILPAVVMAAQALPALQLAGPTPTAAEAGLLDALGLAGAFVALDGPARAERLLVPGAIPAHEAPTDAAALTLLARLRPPAQPGAPAGLALLPQPGQRFSLRNQASVSAWLRARRIAILDPDGGDYAPLAAQLGAATLVLIAEPAQAGLLALCQPGTRVVEIAPEGWARARIRTLCAALDLPWRLFLGAAPTYPVSTALPFGAPTAMAFELSIAALNKALSLL
jgi:hypothetical protein